MNYVVAFRLIGSLKANILRLLTFFLGWIQVSGEQKRSGFSFIHNQHLRCLSRVWQAIHLLSLRREHEAVHSSQEESASTTIQWGIPEWLFLAISILRASDCWMFVGLDGIIERVVQVLLREEDVWFLILSSGILNLLLALGVGNESTSTRKFEVWKK